MWTQGPAGVFTGPSHGLLAPGNATDEAMCILRLSMHFKGNIQCTGMKMGTKHYAEKSLYKNKAIQYKTACGYF